LAANVTGKHGAAFVDGAAWDGKGGTDPAPSFEVSPEPLAWHFPGREMAACLGTKGGRQRWRGQGKDGHDFLAAFGVAACLTAHDDAAQASGLL
jgi:hypothetical protein